MWKKEAKNQNEVKQRRMARYLLTLSDEKQRGVLSLMRRRAADNVRRYMDELRAQEIASWNADVKKVFLHQLEKSNRTKYLILLPLIAAYEHKAKVEELAGNASC